MPSSFTWLDFSEGERRQALEVIDQFRDEDTRDELGIGTVRDAIADLLFPGISTIQTRARYFLFIPWIYLELERRKLGYSLVGREARKAETILIDKLVESGADVGVIGRVARGKLQRLPSNVYWSGLRTWGILQLSRSQEDYHRWLDTYYERIRCAPTADESDDAPTIDSANWHPHLPPSPEGFPAGATFDLTFEEADYLADRVRQRTEGSLLAYFVGRQILPEDVPFPWMHAAYANFPSELRRLVDHARHFSEVMHGAALIYNLLLAESHPQFADQRESYRSDLEAWWSDFPETASSPVAGKLKEFWELVEHATAHRIPPATKTFITQWHQFVFQAPATQTIADESVARSLVRERERNIKRGRARIGNERMVQDWGGQSGSAQLNYRWPTAMQVIDDIVRPLEETM